MAVTATKTQSVRSVLNNGTPDKIGNAAHKVGLGNSLSVVKATFTGLSAAAARDITTAAAKAAAVIAGIELATGENLPPIGQVLSCRVTAGAAAAGARLITDVGGTPAAGVATVSDDGKTLTFEGTVTALVLQYVPRAQNLDETFAPST